MKIFLFVFILCSCSMFKKLKSGSLEDGQVEEISLPKMFKDQSFNLLIVYDFGTKFTYAIPQWEQHIQYLLWKLSEDKNFLVALSTLDNRYDFALASTDDKLSNTKLPVGGLKNITLKNLKTNTEKYAPGLKYTLNKLRYLRKNKFFHRELNTYVIFISAYDDNDIYKSMDGLRKNDHFPIRLQELKNLNQEIHTKELLKTKLYDFKKFRFFSISPSSNFCSRSRKDHFRYRMASKEVYHHYMGASANPWPDHYDYCHVRLNRIFEDLFRKLHKNS